MQEEQNYFSQLLSAGKLGEVQVSITKESVTNIIVGLSALAFVIFSFSIIYLKIKK